ncbi:MAG: class I SAM-dependent methyltransferase [Candidatus Hydrogenedentes bacterium]|nr:class I SAM-dependent methyltransferase [Candidatus Hydrogenedentota bacterium]
MKLRESGMPDEAYWETLFDVDLILARLGIDDALRDVVELGCGYGTFTIPVARRIRGVMRTVDIDSVMVARTARRAEDAGLTNVVCNVADVFSDGFGVEPRSQDGCLLFNILHCEEPVRLLSEAARVVRPGGSIFVIHWRTDIPTPRGPSTDIRPKPESIIHWAEQTGMLANSGGALDLPPWHYGLRFSRVSSPAPRNHWPIPPSGAE